MHEEYTPISNIFEKTGSFCVIQTTSKAQIARLKLSRGEQTSEEPNTHTCSEQILLVVEGEIEADIAGDTRAMEAGDVVIIPQGVPHLFRNTGEKDAVAFTAYVPPEYDG